jgi:hypothetical protein
MVNLSEIMRQMAENAEAIRSFTGSISSEQAKWKPDPETWSMKEVMEHVYNEERGDFRAHIQEMFHAPPQPWGALQPGWKPMESCQQALEGFLAERAASLAWLRALNAPDWDLESRASFGPDGGELVLKAGDVLVSWLAHDYLHIRQMNELQFAWNEHQGLPYSVEYAGGW